MGLFLKNDIYIIERQEYNGQGGESDKQEIPY